MQARDVDEVMAAQEAYLKHIIQQALMDERTESLRDTLNAIFDCCHQLVQPLQVCSDKLQASSHTLTQHQSQVRLPLRLPFRLSLFSLFVYPVFFGFFFPPQGLLFFHFLSVTHSVRPCSALCCLMPGRLMCLVWGSGDVARARFDLSCWSCVSPITL